MLYSISEKGLSKTHKVRVFNFPGGTSEKITVHLHDLIKGKPDNLTVHIGTNDIANNVNLLNNVEKIFRKISKDSIYTTTILFDNRSKRQKEFGKRT